MERSIAYENASVCVVCNKKVKRDKLKAMKIDGFWICGSNCIDKFLKAREMWNPKGWDEVCKMQMLYEERKRAEINTANKELSKIN